VSIDLFRFNEEAAQQRLVDGVCNALTGRGKPDANPPYPGAYAAPCVVAGDIEAPVAGRRPARAPTFPERTRRLGPWSPVVHRLRGFATGIVPPLALPLVVVIVAAIVFHPWNLPESSAGEARGDTSVIVATPSGALTPSPTSGIPPATVSTTPPTERKIYDVSSDNRSHFGEKPAYPSSRLTTGDQIDEVVKSSEANIVSCRFVLGRDVQDSYGGTVRVQVIQNGQTLFARDVRGLNNAPTDIDLGIAIDPVMTWTLRLTNVGDVAFSVYLKGGFDDVRDRRHDQPWRHAEGCRGVPALRCRRGCPSSARWRAATTPTPPVSTCCMCWRLTRRLGSKADLQDELEKIVGRHVDLVPKSRLTPPPGVRASMGPVAAGVTGFQRSHLGAQAAARVAATTGELGNSWYFNYADLAVVSLATCDPQQARWFVEETLGALGQPGPRRAELRETLRVYLAFGRSRLRAPTSDDHGRVQAVPPLSSATSKSCAPSSPAFRFRLAPQATRGRGKCRCRQARAAR